MCGYDVSKCIFKSEIDGLDFIPSSLDLCALDKELVGVQRKEYVLKDVLDKVKSDYDFVFIDCAPSINMLLVNALCAADGVIIPLQCEYLALEGMNQLLNTVRLAKGISTILSPYTAWCLRCTRDEASCQETSKAK